MPLFLVLCRTYDSIKNFYIYTKQCSEMALDLRGGQTKLYFAFNHTLPDFWQLGGAQGYYISAGPISRSTPNAKPHIKVNHVVFQREIEQLEETQLLKGEPKQERLLAKENFNRRYSVPDMEQYAQGDNQQSEVFEQHIFIVPKSRCTFYVNGHLASCLALMVHKSQKFRRHFIKNIAHFNAFHDCLPDYATWDMNLLEDVEFFAVPYMIDIVAVWPLQRLDYAW